LRNIPFTLAKIFFIEKYFGYLRTSKKINWRIKINLDLPEMVARVRNKMVFIEADTLIFQNR